MRPWGKVILLCLLPAVLLAQRREKREFIIRGEGQGTTYAIRYFAEDSVVTKHAVDSILLVIDGSMSLYNPNSLISRFNASATGIQMDTHMQKVVRMARSIWGDTHGTFDVTIAPLMALWGMGVKSVSQLPDSAAVKTALACVGMQHLQISRDGYLSKTKPCVQIDLNGIAQGYTVDLISAYIQHKKITAFMVELGGELYIGGPKPDGTYFKIGIEAPLANSSEPKQRILSIKRGAVTTSGNYRKSINNRQINHLINPFTGYPVENENISVTLVAKNALLADGYDNAIMAGKRPYNIAMARRHKMALYMIHRTESGAIKEVMSDNFVKLLAKQHPN